MDDEGDSKRRKEQRARAVVSLPAPLSSEFPGSARPDCRLEAARLRAVTRLASEFRKAAARHLGGKWQSFFCEWALGPCSGAESVADMIIPPLASVVDGGARRHMLARMLQKKGMSNGDIESVCDAVQTAVEFATRGELTTFTGRSSDTDEHEVVVLSRCSDPSTKVELSCCGGLVTTSEPFLGKLYALYRRGNNDEIIGTFRSDQEFLRAAFCCLARYLSVMGGSARTSGGLHAALPDGVFELLERYLDINVELFASPLNVNMRSSGYCSAFGDVDAAFGSLGSFFDFYPAEGSFEANPPFVDSLVMRMVNHMTRLLSAAERKGGALSFAVIVKKERDAKSWQAIRDSKWKRFQMTVWQGEHTYIDGGSYLCASSQVQSHRAALHDSSFFLLQTSKGQERWQLKEHHWESIKDAFNAKDVPKDTSL